MFLNIIYVKSVHMRYGKKQIIVCTIYVQFNSYAIYV